MPLAHASLAFAQPAQVMVAGRVTELASRGEHLAAALEWTTY
jgi:hypothetical protein